MKIRTLEMLHDHHEDMFLKNFALTPWGEKRLEAAPHLFAFLLELFCLHLQIMTKGAFFCNSVMSFLSFNVQFYCFFKKEEGGRKTTTHHFTVGLKSGMDKRSLCMISNIHTYLSNSI